MLGEFPYKGGYAYPMPNVVDWNNDGKKDVVCGNGSGQVHLLLNEGTNAEPVFNTAEWVEDGATGQPIKAFSHSSPVVIDFNRDGKKDLLIGGYWGTIHYFENKGTDAAPYFEGGVELLVDGELLDVGTYSRLDATDWNEDGIVDLLCGFSSTTTPTAGVLCFESIGALSLDSHSVSAGAGGTVTMSLDAGQTHAGRTFFVVGSLTGSEPGTPLPGGIVVLPINWDIFTDIMLSLLNTSVCQNFMGTLDGAGIATATLNAPPVPTALGAMMTYAYALKNPWDFASNPGRVEFLP